MGKATREGGRGDLVFSSSYSGDERSTSGDGESSLRRSASISSDWEEMLEVAGEIISGGTVVRLEGSNVGWHGYFVR